MRKNRFVLAAVFLVVAAAAAWLGALYERGLASDSSFRRTSEADFLSVRGEYVLILPSSRLMAELLGPKWAEETLFYRCDRGISQDGKAVASASGSFEPLAKGRPAIRVSGDSWTDLGISIFTLESRKQVTVRVNLRSGAIERRPETPVAPRELRVTPKGELIVWY